MTSGAALGLALAATVAPAQSPDSSPATSSASRLHEKSLEDRVDALNAQVEALTRLVLQLQRQLAEQSNTNAASLTPVPAEAPKAPTATIAPGPATAVTAPGAGSSSAPDWLHGVTLNALLDGYYEYNFDSPVGRVNSLRAYDVSSNSFSLNQAALMIEKLPDPASGQRLGLRLDLQYGQATETLQGNPANELRPEIYRNIFQAYGTYVIPLAQGLTVDFGKWASSLGIEGNYTKDQLNYSRSFWFDFLPFYHAGLRSKLAVNDRLALNLWITNGTDQTEAFNNYKDQLYGFVLTPLPAVAWTFNYYRGQEHPDVTYLQNTNPAPPGLPNEQGTYIVPIANAPAGKLQILDTYVSWQAVKALAVAAELDYVQERLYPSSSPQRVEGGAIYAAYTFSPEWAIALRGEYLADVGGLYSGEAQYLKEATFSFDYRPADGFLLRGEYRRDESNRRFFYGHTLDVLDSAQPTLGLGLVWWFGGKQGAW